MVFAPKQPMFCIHVFVKTVPNCKLSSCWPIQLFSPTNEDVTALEQSVSFIHDNSYQHHPWLSSLQFADRYPTVCEVCTLCHVLQGFFLGGSIVGAAPQHFATSLPEAKAKFHVRRKKGGILTKKEVGFSQPTIWINQNYGHHHSIVRSIYTQSHSRNWDSLGHINISHSFVLSGSPPHVAFSEITTRCLHGF